MFLLFFYCDFILYVIDEKIYTRAKDYMKKTAKKKLISEKKLSLLPVYDRM